MGETTNGPVEVGADQHKGILLIIAKGVEGRCPKIVLRCPEQSLNSLQSPSVLDNSVENVSMMLSKDIGVKF